MTEVREGFFSSLQALPETRAIVEAVLAIWPEHVAYLAKSFAPRTDAQQAATELAAKAARRIMSGDEARYARGYKWTCDKLRDEELFFHREGRYRLSTFAEADAEVYANPDYMGPYVDGLLLTQILWYNHVATFEMFLRTLADQRWPFDYLEIGPGHGLMVYFAAQADQARSIEAIDVSATSLSETRAALDALGVTRPVTLTRQDILAAGTPTQSYDLITISEVLEHLERPNLALGYIARALAPDGRVFINIPLNSPSPDHIYLLSTLDEVRALVTGAGLAIEAEELYATQARPIAKALANKVSVSAGIIARRA